MKDKMTVTFNLKDEDSIEDLKMYLNSHNYLHTLKSIEQYLDDMFLCEPDSGFDVPILCKVKKDIFEIIAREQGEIL